MSAVLPPLSLLDLATVARDQPVAEALDQTVTLARTADELGAFERLWFAEHHNMPRIASAATSVLIAHVAARTERIRVGSGGVMLPNHSPLVIAEQFGTLAELHPGRIDLGLGRAPGTDGATMRALRTDPRAAEAFPHDVRELQGYLSGETRIEGIHAYPGRGTNVPLYILGSSLFGAQLAAAYGLPYAFASHFAPDALEQAVRTYRAKFTPSEQLAEPHVIAALNVIAADDSATAQAAQEKVLHARVRMLAGRVGSGGIDDDMVVALLDTQVGAQAKHMLTHTVAGDPDEVASGLADFAALADADELMVTNPAPGLDQRVRTLQILAEVAGRSA
ncbi:LLM class flavin-dependent oxidoreductase [Janibacter cremeus]|uniref:LLM class flavin-dependent oxidoreductase n=1 Tax=Janibacter cremeus TaxID=1285192 RepID=UPI0023F93154|nr:LLM class flavin-dependent oxidoreductase [Janibacter cremeus]WEV77198.1 LLM class flavin-dependent oxidoreductase [Janibacter cremeus]